jgi:hypothetical protein
MDWGELANKLSNMGGRKEGKKQTQKDSGWQRRMKHLKKSERSIQTVDKTEEREDIGQMAVDILLRIWKKTR